MSKSFMKWSGIVLIAFAGISFGVIFPDPFYFFVHILPKLFILVVGCILLERGRK
jgi:hypothetical protein